MRLSNPWDGSHLFDLEPEPEPVARLDRAREAQAAWAALGAIGRAAKLSAAADRVAGDATLADLIVSDVGKPITEARAEVARSAAILRYAASLATGPAGEVYEDATGASVRVLRFPRGAVLLVTPWNFPIAIPTWKIAPALQAGNAVVLKPATQSARIAERLVEHLDLGDVVQLVKGGRDVVGALLDARPDAVSFTGSTATGRSIAERLAGSFVPLQLEMGGKNGVYVSEAANPQVAAKVALGGAMGYAGQKCTATSLLFVHANAQAAVVAALQDQVAGLGVGDPADEKTVVGPMIEAAKRDEVAEQIGGAEVLAGAEARGHGVLAPTLLTGDHPTNSEELFAPVLSVLPVEDMDEALARLHALEYGLVAGIVSPLREEIEAFARRAEAGIVRVNAPTAGVEPHVPFGGTKNSSFGPREQGRAGLDFFSETRTIYGVRVPYGGDADARRHRRRRDASGGHHGRAPAERPRRVLRTFLMHEPRGHSAMSGALLQPPVHPDADWGVVFIEVSGCLPMCGHGTIGVATVLVERGLVEVTEPETVVRLDVPAGLVEARVRVRDGRAEAVTIRNVDRSSSAPTTATTCRSAATSTRSPTRPSTASPSRRSTPGA